LAESRKRLIPQRVHTRTDRQGVADQHMQALDPGGHSTSGDAIDLDDIGELATAT
jgi:hypothetical protein